MAIMAQVVGEAFNIVVRNEQSVRGFEGTPILAARQQSTTSPAPPATSSPSSGSNGGPTSSPLLFFVALGFGVVFTNLWIIVGVKYCFRYNARNRAIRNGEDVDQINLDNMPPRPHRRRKEKKLMTMDEVNERFPLTKYKAWVAKRLSAGLPTAGGVTASPSRAGSVRNVDGALPSSPVETKHSVNTRPATAASEVVVTPDSTSTIKEEQKVVEKDKSTIGGDERGKAEEATAAPVGKQVTSNSMDDDDDDDDHIHTAVPPELLTNPGDSCAICIDTLEDDDDIRGLTCGHAFHAGCLDPWLTSRRACCPLCKADYYTPKPRPEGEAAAEADRSGRRRGESRMNMPQEPRSTWSGLRDAPRILLPTRLGGVALLDHYNHENRRQDRRQAARNQSTATPAAPQTTETNSPQSRWRNPFAAIRGRSRNAEEPAAVGTEPSPRQLEAGNAAATSATVAAR